MSVIKQPVLDAIEEVKASYPGRLVDVSADEQGGARVVVHDLDLGGRFNPSHVSVGFVIGFQYPASDVYPHYVMPPIQRIDGGPLTAPLSPSSWNGVPVIQVSRRSNRWNPNFDTAATKLGKVLEWIRSA